jgi:hypothetical protein
VKSDATPEFWEAYRRLPAEMRALADKAHRHFAENPGLGGLEFKKVGSRHNVYSARVGATYRAPGVLEGDTVTWFWIGHHRVYDRLLRDL